MGKTHTKKNKNTIAIDDIVLVQKPKNALPLVFDSPHSGVDFPRDFKHSCTKTDIKQTSDYYVDDLFAAAPDHNAVLLAAKFPRAYVDVNRAIDDIDPSLLNLPDDETFEWPFKEGIKPTQRSAAGIGLIRRLVRPGVPVYERPIGAAVILERIKKYYIPYHQTLSDLVEDAHYRYGKSWFIDCHSMPPESAVPKRAIGFVHNRAAAVDICLGNRDGTTCAPEFVHLVREFFEDKGYTVSVNDPFKGVELIARHGMPAIGRNALQIEINRGLYMDGTRKNTRNFNTLKTNIDAFIAHSAAYVNAQMRSLAAD